MLKNALQEIVKKSSSKAEAFVLLDLLETHETIRQECLVRASKGETEIILSYKQSKLGNALSNFTVTNKLFIVSDLRQLFDLLQSDGLTSVRVGNQLIINWA